MTRLLIVLYLMLNVLDLVCTAYLSLKLKHNIEGNPLAAFCYQQGGLIGMFLLKTLAIAVVISILGVLSQNERGQRYCVPTLAFGITTLLAVVTYSVCLIMENCI